MPDFDDFPDQRPYGSNDYSDFPDQSPFEPVKAEKPESTLDKTKRYATKAYETSMNPLLPEIPTTGHRVIGGQMYGIPDPTDVETYKGFYNEVIRPLSAPLGLIATGLGLGAGYRGRQLGKTTPTEPPVAKVAEELPKAAETPKVKPKYRLHADGKFELVTPKEEPIVKPKVTDVSDFPDQSPFQYGEEGWKPKPKELAESNTPKTEVLNPPEGMEKWWRDSGFNDYFEKDVTPESKPKVEVPKVEEKPNLAKKLLTEEEGSFDPTEITRKIRKALDDAEEYKGYIPHPEPRVRTTVGKLFAAVQDAKENSILNEELLSFQKSERASKFASIKGSGEARAKAQMATLKGKYERVQGQPLKLAEPDVKELFDIIGNGPLRPYEKARGYTAMWKLMEGETPQRNELMLLDRIYGKGFGNAIIDMHGGIGGPISKTVLNETIGLSRAMKSSFDLSGIRQGAALAHRPEFWKSFVEMNKGLGTAEAYQTTMDSIYSKEMFQPTIKVKGKAPVSFAKLSGLKITNLEDYAHQEEGFMTKLAKKIPGLSHSERAYSGFLNKLRADTFESLINAADKAGLDPKNNIPLAQELAGYVNNATGRGSLGNLEKHAVLINQGLFAPRLMSSRIAMLNPYTYAKATPFVRQQYIKSLGSLVTLGSATLATAELAKLAFGADVKVSPHPTSPDFGKAQIGNARLDPWFGHQQYIVALTNFINEVKNNAEGQKAPFGKTPAIPKFLYYKLSPAASTAVRLAFSKDPVSGQKLTIPDEIWRNFMPMFAEDVYNIVTTEPAAWPLIPLAFYGMGSQSYEPHQPKQQSMSLPPMR